MRGCCIIYFKLYWSSGRGDQMESLVIVPPWDLGMTVAVHSTCKDSAVVPLLGPIVTAQTEHTKDMLSICTTSSVLHAPVLQSISLRAVWPIHALCNRRCYLAAVFCDVELATIWRFAWHISAAVSSPTLRCLICGNWPSNLGLRGLSSDVHQLSGRTQLTRVLLQHLIFDRTLNNRLIVLIYTSNSTVISAGEIGKSHAMIMISCPCFTWVWESGDDSCVALWSQMPPVFQIQCPLIS